MTEEERCRQTAQNRLKDALILFQQERYVIELGIKKELHRIGNIAIHNEEVNSHSKAIIKHLGSNAFKEKDGSYPRWLNNFKFPETLFEYISFINNIGQLAAQKNLKSLYNRIDESSEFQVILTNRQLPTKDENSSTFHNISAFLQSLNEWKIAIGESDFSIDNYNIEKLNWGTHLRYGEPGINIIEDERQNSEQALKMAMNFLKHVVLIDISEFENQLNPNNQSSPNNIEGY
jgi:hypothetical protein